jgi:hypothetical protein
LISSVVASLRKILSSDINRIGLMRRFKGRFLGSNLGGYDSMNGSEGWIEDLIYAPATLKRRPRSPAVVPAKGLIPGGF